MTISNTISFQYKTGEPYIMTVYRIKGIERRDTRKDNDDISYTVRLSEEPQQGTIDKVLQLPNIFMKTMLTAFENDEFVLVSDNNGIADSVIVIQRPSRFSVREYLSK